MHRLHTVARSRWASSALLASLVALPLHAWAQEPNWSIGGYLGQYHDAEPAGALAGRAKYIDQYMIALTGAKTVWRSSDWPVSLEIDAMLGYQSGVASLGEFAIAPALRWSGFPWRHIVRTDLQSTSWSPPTRRMLLTLVPCLSTVDEPLTFRSLMRTTASPSCNTWPLESFTTASPSSSAALAAACGHSKPQSAQTKLAPSG